MQRGKYPEKIGTKIAGEKNTKNVREKIAQEKCPGKN